MNQAPVFHADWFTANIPMLEKYLGHLKGEPYVEGLEIGCWEGRSTIWFLQTILTGSGSRITCVDNFTGNPENELRGYESNVPEIFKNNISVAGVSDRVSLVQQKSCVALKYLLPLGFDFVYVDGSHNPKDVLFDLVMSWQLLKHGGIMILDDYLLRDPVTGSEPKPAVDAFHFVMKSEIIELHQDWQVIWRKI